MHLSGIDDHYIKTSSVPIQDAPILTGSPLIWLLSSIIIRGVTRLQNHG